MVPRRIRALERQVVHDVITWLRSEGWICRRQHVGTFQPLSGGPPVKMGETGEPDWRCMRAMTPGVAQYFELEAKRPGETPEDHQLEKMAKRTYQGFLVTWSDSLDSFKTWYSQHYD